MFGPKLKEGTEAILSKFIRDKVQEAGAKGVVVGLSGGLDSAVTIKLCVDALGADSCHGLIMPASNLPADMQQAREHAESLGITWHEVDISPILDRIIEVLPWERPDTAKGNVKARIRMITLYDYAFNNGLVVMGTGNKSETAVGYYTKHGDGGVDYVPIADLYKTEVRELARNIDVPEHFITKPPSAGLWEGQTDEDEMGITYDMLDKVLLGMEMSLPDEEILEKSGATPEQLEKVKSMNKRSVHKRRRPLCPKLGLRTFGLDWRE